MNMLRKLLPARFDREAKLARVDQEMHNAVARAISSALAQRGVSPNTVVVIDKLTVNVQINAASGGGATVNVKNGN